MTKSEKKDNIFVARFVREKYGLELIPLCPKDVKTPDFQIGQSGTRQVGCEIKAFEDEDPQQWRTDPETGIGVKSDNGPARVARRIHKAQKQLLRFEKRILIFLNKDPLLDHGDLVDVFRGYRPYFNNDGGVFGFDTSSRKVMAGMTLKERFEIDLYIWIDYIPGSDRGTEPKFYVTSDVGVELAKEHFNVPKDV